MPEAERTAANRTIVRRLLGLPEFRSARHIAVFLAFDGEPSLAPLIGAAAERGKRLYAPVITRRHMHFAELDTRAVLARNFFGILEPSLGRAIDARRLDLVMTPLVAFDDRGVRVGVGRGYYDRCFRFLRTHERWHRPKLIGVAYELQHVPPQTLQSWDIPLWGAVTEAGVRRF
jgi:5-formyltetrahydrofolate cyclo-ligase